MVEYVSIEDIAAYHRCDTGTVRRAYNALEEALENAAYHCPPRRTDEVRNIPIFLAAVVLGVEFFEDFTEACHRYVTQEDPDRT